MKLNLFNAHTDKMPKLTTLEQVVNLIREDEVLRCHTSKHRELRMSPGRGHEAEVFKRQTPRFAVAAIFTGGRRKADFSEWTGLSLVDIDHVPQEVMEEVRQRAMDDPHTLLCYVTISGHGLRILYRYVCAGFDEMTFANQERAYKEAFRMGNSYYSDLLGLPTDGQCCDVTRLSGLAHDPKVFYRGDEGDPFTISIEVDPTPTPRPHVKFERALAAAREQLEREGVIYTDHHRNEYVMRMGYLLNEYGASLMKSVQWAVGTFTDYDGDVAGVIRSCFRQTEKHGTVSLPHSPKGRPREVLSVEEIEGYLKQMARFRHNELTRMTEICWAGEEEFHVLTDRDECTLWSRMNKEQHYTRIQDVRLVLTSDFVPMYHPLQDYLYHQLPEWKEGDPDYIGQLAETVTLVEETPEIRELFVRCLRKWLVAVVVAILGHRVNHEILVLIGKQGIYKTTWFHYLFPPSLRAYYVPKSNCRRMTKDDRLLMAECALICLEELSSMTDEEMDQLKAAATAPHIVERAAYARHKEVRRHIASFCGTGNIKQFLTDLTGDRRWLPFEVARIRSPYEHDLPYEGIYSQAMYLWQSGFVYWFDEQETDRMKPYLEQFKVSCPEEELVGVYFRRPLPGEGIFMTTTDILASVNAGLRTPLSATKIGLILTKLGYAKARDGIARGYIVYQRSAEEIQHARRVIAFGGEG